MMTTLLSDTAYTDNVSKEKTTLHLNVFQTLSENSALAHTNSLDAIAFYSREVQLYDGKRITAKCQLVDTYTYVTKNDVVKTVPVFMPLSEYQKNGYTKGDCQKASDY